MEHAQKVAACKFLRGRFPWLTLGETLRIVNYSSYHGGFRDWRGDLSTVGLSCMRRLALENRKRAEGLSARNFKPRSVRKDSVFVDHAAAVRLEQERIERLYGILPVDHLEEGLLSEL